MAVTIHVNGKSLSLVHKGSNCIAKCTIPDVCKTPSPGGPVPVPYPVIVSMSSDLKKGTKTVKVDGKKMAAVKGAEFSRCTGDEPGTAGGVKSSTNMKEATWILYSFDVKLDGKNACRLSDKMMMNHGNTACLEGPTQQSVSGVPPCAHEWEIPPDKSGDDAQKKKKDLRDTGDPADKFEADAADHNNVTDGDCMSGPPEEAKSKLYPFCKKCGERGGEIDHVERDQNGNVTKIVECKSGNCHIDADQMNRQQAIAKNMGATHEYKLQAGAGADKGEAFIQGKPWNVIVTKI
jgi:hypothetical protein